MKEFEFEIPVNGSPLARLVESDTLEFNMAAARYMKMVDGHVHFRVGISKEDDVLVLMISSAGDRNAFIAMPYDGKYRISGITSTFVKLGHTPEKIGSYSIAYDARESCYVLSPIWNP